MPEGGQHGKRRKPHPGCGRGPLGCQAGLLREQSTMGRQSWAAEAGWAAGLPPKGFATQGTGVRISV